MYAVVLHASTFVKKYHLGQIAQVIGIQSVASVSGAKVAEKYQITPSWVRAWGLGRSALKCTLSPIVCLVLAALDSEAKGKAIRLELSSGCRAEPKF
jgi:hypothetical protein